MTGQIQIKAEQLSFIALHFPQHYDKPADILIWLHDAAEFRDDHQRISQESKPKIQGLGAAQPKKQQFQLNQDDEVDYNESSFGAPKNYKEVQKKKEWMAAGPPQRNSKY